MTTARDREPARSATLVPMAGGSEEASEDAKALLVDACQVFGVDPTLECDPPELANWRYYPEDRRNKLPASVVIVTHGGVKVKHFADPDFPMDEETENTLARIFNSFTKNAKKEVVRIPLPEDLALPINMITGIATATEHRYRRGYMKEGGKQEANRREAAAKKKGK